MIRRASANGTHRVEILEADLLTPNSWSNALKNVTLVVHTASPAFYINSSVDKSILIKPAVEGTINVLKAAYDANVKRVVLTSSLTAMLPDGSDPSYFSGAKYIDEKVWTNTNSPFTDAYSESKTLAEKAAWNFVQEKRNSTGKCFDLAVINPSNVFGPTFHTDLKSLGSSEKAFKSLIEASQPNRTNEYLPVVDVRGMNLILMYPNLLSLLNFFYSSKHFLNFKMFTHLRRFNIKTRFFKN